ncbi:hypothetical protein [Rhizobium binae]|uniref:hypothetical protein n=1 Tax=Rhizobium binae TaxID=1138190 RepID=UPI001C835D30|nr:hypothetical protein [Rhizobium binae]MBX4967865.1 hypothetical protein [Rhizobium binae]
MNVPYSMGLAVPPAQVAGRSIEPWFDRSMLCRDGLSVKIHGSLPNRPTIHIEFGSAWPGMEFFEEETDYPRFFVTNKRIADIQYAPRKCSNIVMLGADGMIIETDRFDYHHEASPRLTMQPAAFFRFIGVLLLRIPVRELRAVEPDFREQFNRQVMARSIRPIMPNWLASSPVCKLLAPDTNRD